MFAFPLAFLWLAAAAPVLVLLYLVRQQTRVYRVPSILHLLALPEARLPVRRRLARFVADPLFYLQLLLLLLLVTALARPLREKIVRHAVFIMDVTASMQAREGERNRLSLAVEKARRFIERAGPDDRIAVLAAGRRVQVVTPFTSDRDVLRRGLSSLEATDTAGTCAEAAYTAANMLLSAGGGSMVLFTDSALAVPEGLIKEGLGIRIEGVGTERQNAGILSAIAPMGLLGTGGRVVAQIRNFSRDDLESEASLYVGDEECARTSLRIPPMRGQTVTLEAPGKSGLARLLLHAEDALAVDNQVHLWLPDSQPLALRIVSPSAALADFLGALGLFRLSRVLPQQFAPAEGETPEVTLLDGWVPSEPPAGNTIYLHPRSSGPLFRHRGTAPGEVYSWLEGHPILDQIGLDNLRFEELAMLDIATEAEVILSDRNWPLLAIAERDGERQVLCALPLVEMLQDPTAVLLLFRMLEWCSPRSRARDLEFPAGSPLTCPLPMPAQDVTLFPPRGASVTLQPAGSRIVWTDTQRSGPYRVVAPGLDRTYVATVSGPGESDLTHPAESVEVVQAGANGERAKIRTTASAWILWAVPILLVLEWLAFFWRKRRLDDAS
ncbi:MAG: VWA domain-containing protein [Planctomycetes bacterium]|nr:VWA domain-containing protein [Planctomycetota bacterium]